MTSPLPGGDRAPFLDTVIDVRTLASLLDHAHDAVIVRRLDGEILYWNKGAERTYGWSAAEAIGQSSHALFRTRFPRPLVALLDLVRERGEWEGRLIHTRRDGRTLTVESRWALDGPLGAETVLEINRDITSRIEAQEQVRARERQLQFVADNAPVAIAHCDTQHRFKFVNRPYSARFGLQPSELTGRTVAEVVGAPAFEAMLPHLNRVLAGESVEVEASVPYDALGVQFMRFAYEPELDDTGEVIGYVAAIVNVSERHAAEEALRDANRRKDAFLATLAHELRNPLAAMANAVQLMRAAKPGGATSERAHAIFERQLKQLVRLVDDLLDVSRITRGQLQLRMDRVELAEVIRTAVEAAALMPTAVSSHAVTVSVPEGPVVLRADAERLAQVFINLMTNARKYTPAGGRITLTAEADPETVSVTVSDTGVGIPPPMLERVFEMFEQVERSRDQAYGGLGIGLTLVRSLVELHGGTVSAASAGENRGSSFVVRLPRLQAAEGSKVDHRTAATGEELMQRRVLIADDNVDAAESLQLWLQMAGHDVHVAHDGLSAVATAESVRPEVVLLDLGMPGMSGFDVARIIRKKPWGREMVLIALTGWGQEEDRRQTTAAGFDHHLTKPVPPDDVEALIRNA